MTEHPSQFTISQTEESKYDPRSVYMRIREETHSKVAAKTDNFQHQHQHTTANRKPFMSNNNNQSSSSSPPLSDATYEIATSTDTDTTDRDTPHKPHNNNKTSFATSLLDAPLPVDFFSKRGFILLEIGEWSRFSDRSPDSTLVHLIVQGAWCAYYRPAAKLRFWYLIYQVARVHSRYY